MFRFLRDGIDLNNTDVDEAQGEMRQTQVEVDSVIGMTHSMFKHVVALNTYTEPFLSMRANDQRELIEELLGITELSRKAEALKDVIKETKDEIKEEYSLKSKEDANSRILKNINDIERRSRIWQEKHDNELSDLEKGLDSLSHVDIKQELANHQLLKEYTEKKSKLNETNRWIDSINSDNEKLSKLIDRVELDIENLKNHKCFACGQELHDDKQEEILREKEELLGETRTSVLENDTKLKEYEKIISEVGELSSPPEVFYENLNDAYEHQNSVSVLKEQIETKKKQEDPYTEQIAEMRESSLEELDYSKMNALNSYREHRDFLMKLLTNKDSFIRKKIIDQNLSYLNQRLEFYLDKLGLPHEVKFMSDLTVEITELGRELDFDNLSRGERNRLILGLSWSFRDIFESLYSTVNVLFVDELIDSGMDTNGVESSLAVLKKMQRDRSRSIFLISHRDELYGRVTNVLNVIKENGFTTFSQEDEVSPV